MLPIIEHFFNLFHKDVEDKMKNRPKVQLGLLHPITKVVDGKQVQSYEFVSDFEIDPSLVATDFAIGNQILANPDLNTAVKVPSFSVDSLRVAASADKLATHIGETKQHVEFLQANGKLSTSETVETVKPE